MSGSTCVFGPGYLALRAVAILPAVCTTPVMQAAAAVVAPRLSVERLLQEAKS